MPRQKRHANRVYQVVGEPGAIAVGYVRYSMELQDAASIVTQKRRITEFAEKKGWKLVRWYEEPEHSAKYEEIEQRPVFAQLLNDAGTRFQVALCYMNNRGHGTIETPSGELVEGKHQAAWPYDLWQRMVEVKAGKWRRPRKEAQRRPHEFSRIIVCAACCRALRVFLPRGIPYYKDASSVRKLECPALGFKQFGVTHQTIRRIVKRLERR